ncbi:ubinuclein-2-like isoform X3 [Chiloscyllium plagiosum]|uniref:ubinuclein-2-like isoform X3 n=1 Tax=Chiloscyllium plagiosum TaxID=36176 RepID=UPI001CB83E15|nr:ubinuclein-2-like isoform X3 [Chiloscyllium plagiosum]
MTEPRRVAFNTVPAPQAAAVPVPPVTTAKKKRREERNGSAPANVRFGLRLSEPSDRSHTEYNYNELLREAKRNFANPDDPFNDEEKERKEVEALAKKLEEKYGQKNHKRRKDRMQDLIDMGYGYDDTDPFIDNSEAYDELVPASLTTKYGGFYINTGTLQFRQTSDTEDEDVAGKKRLKSPKFFFQKQKLKDGEDRVAKKQRRKDEGGMKEKKSRKLKVSKESGVVALNADKHKKKRKSHSDALSLAEMLKKFQKEKEAMKKQEMSMKPIPALQVPEQAIKNAAGSDISVTASDQVFAILGNSNENDLLQEAANAMELLGDLDIDKLLAETPSGSPASETEENSNTAMSSGFTLAAQSQKQLVELPVGLPVLLEKQIKDLKTLCAVHLNNETHAGKGSEGEGKKKFFTPDINTILLDIELQLQELNVTVRSAVYSYLASFLPCSKDTLMKRLKKLHLNDQDERLRDPTQKLKEAVASVMPAQLVKYQEELQAHTQARFAKMASEEDRDKNGSEEDDDDKPGRRVMGPRKKFLWNDYVRDLLCNLVKIKLGCYELEQNKSQSAEDYLKAFMETEVKPIWPKGWMQARMLLKESKRVHNHLTATPAKKKVIFAPKPKVKDSSPKKEQRLSTPASTVPKVVPTSKIMPVSISSSSCNPSRETIYLDDSLDEDLSLKPPSLESVSDALSVFNNSTKISRTVNNSVSPAPRPQPVAKEDKKVIAKVTPLVLSPKAASCSPRVATPSPKVGTASLKAGTPSPKAVTQSPKASALSPKSGTSSPKVSTLSPVPLTFSHLFGHSSGTKKSQEGSRPGMTSLIAGYTAPSSQTPKPPSVTSTAKQHQPGLQRLSQSQTQSTKQSQSSMHHNSLMSHPQVTTCKTLQNPVVKLNACPQHLLASHVSQLSDTSTAYPTSFSPSVTSNAQAVSRTSISPSTSSDYTPKSAMPSSTSAQGFKPPFSMASPPKPTTPSNTMNQNVSIGSSNLTGSPTSRQSSSKHSGSPSSSRHLPSGSIAGQQQSTSLVKKTSVPQKMASPPGAGTLGRSTTGGAVSRGSLSVSGAPVRSSGSAGRSSVAGAAGMSTTNRSTTSASVTRSGALSSAAANRSSPSGTVSRTSVSGGPGSGPQVAIKMLPSLHRPPSGSGTSTGIQATAGSTLLANTSSLTLMTSPLNVTNLNATSASLNSAAAFSMLGGLVPVSLPFQLPLNLINFASESDITTTTPTGSTSAPFQHNITQSILKGLQSGSTQLSRSSVPAHLQQAYAATKARETLQRSNGNRNDF